MSSPVPAAFVHLALHGFATLAASGAEPVRLERKQAAVLAYLHHAGRTPRGRLAGLLWPHATASGARANVRQCLARLRRLAPGVLTEDADAVALAATVAVETAAGGRAALLDAYDYSDCDDFARWLRTRVDDERTSRHGALAAALRDALRRGDLDAAQSGADALLALDRESEDPYRALMEVAYLRGDFAAAVRVWNRCREMLGQLYGVAPSMATQALGATILAASASAASAASAASVPAAALPHAGNLGLSLPLLFGRDDDLAALLSLLRAHRLVTLIGIGGVGKTSLARASAHAERDRGTRDVGFVDLVPVVDPHGLPAAVAHALGVGLSGGRDATEALVGALRSRAMLLVLDNAEHLLHAVAALVAALLAGTVQLRLLVTSRQALRLPEEQRFPLAGLSAPAELSGADPRRFGALALFEARAAALDGRFRLTTENAPGVAAVCRRLDGLPLAIELAAARVPLLGVEELRTRLRQSLRVLGAGATSGAPRHETLRDTFDWTHALLPLEEQVLLRRLAVFVGGFTLALAEQVTLAAGDAPRDRWHFLDALGALIDRSLVVASDDDPPRYRLLEVTRAYAHEKLVDAGESDRLSERHAHAIWRLFADAEADLNEKTHDALNRGKFLQRLTPDIDNLRAARAWTGGSAGHRALGVGLAAASTEALRLLGLSTEALREMLDRRAFAAGDDIPAATAELYWTGLCALGTHGRLPAADMFDAIEKAERLYRRAGSPRRLHVGLYRKGFALLHLGRAHDARQAVAEMAAVEEAGWPARAVALRLNLLGAVENVLGRFDAAIVAFDHAAERLDHDAGERDVVLNVQGNLCMALLGAERYEEALRVAAEVLSADPFPVVRNIARRATFVALTFLGRIAEASAVARAAMTAWRSDDMLPHMLGVFAWLAYLEGRAADAIRIDGAVALQAERLGLPNAPVFHRARQHLAAAIAERGLTAADVSRWRQEGERLDADTLIALCVAEPLTAPFGSRARRPSVERASSTTSSSRPASSPPG